MRVTAMESGGGAPTNARQGGAGQTRTACVRSSMGGPQTAISHVLSVVLLPTCAVAVVHVKIDNGHASDAGMAVHIHGVGGADGGVVEQAEAVAAAAREAGRQASGERSTAMWGAPRPGQAGWPGMWAMAALGQAPWEARFHVQCAAGRPSREGLAAASAPPAT